MSYQEKLLQRLEGLLDRIEALVPAPAKGVSQFDGGAYRWQAYLQHGQFYRIQQTVRLRLADLQCIEQQKAKIVQNTRQFLADLPANHVLLWGPKGTGKSSLIKGLLNEYQTQGLNLIEVAAQNLIKLTTIVDQLSAHKGHFILYCDDLSFTKDDPDYSAIKVALDGTISQLPSNILLYATANRRHLVPEFMHDNLASQTIQGELHLSEAIDEKLALAERFGIQLAFHPFTQDQYLSIVDYWLAQLDYANKSPKETQQAALRWALEKGSRSGRVAWQFAKDWAGQAQLNNQ